MAGYGVDIYCPHATRPRDEVQMPEINLLDGLLPENVAAPGLNRVPRTLQRWRRLGIGPIVTMVGNTPMYHVDDVKAWLRAQRKVPAAKRLARRRGA